jgi:predicted alpha/beta hydrolase
MSRRLGLRGVWKGSGEGDDVDSMRGRFLSGDACGLGNSDVDVAAAVRDWKRFCRTGLAEGRRSLRV